MKIVHTDIVDDVVVIIVVVAVTIEICRRNPPLILPPLRSFFLPKNIGNMRYVFVFNILYLSIIYEMYLVEKVLSHYYYVAAVYYLLPADIHIDGLNFFIQIKCLALSFFFTFFIFVVFFYTSNKVQISS